MVLYEFSVASLHISIAIRRSTLIESLNVVKCVSEYFTELSQQQIQKFWETS